MSQVDVHKGPEAAGCCVIFQRGCKVLFTVELKRRDRKRWRKPEGRPSAASHNASSIFRCSFCRQHWILVPLLFDSSREIEMRCCCGMRSHIDSHTDASKYRLNFKSFKPTRIPLLCSAALLQTHGPSSVCRLYHCCTAWQKEWRTTKARPTRLEKAQKNR